MMDIEYVLNVKRLWKRVDRLLRPENTPDVRDVIKLEFRSCKEWIDKWMMNVEYILNDKWLWMRDLRPLRPENTPDVRDVI